MGLATLFNQIDSRGNITILTILSIKHRKDMYWTNFYPEKLLLSWGWGNWSCLVELGFYEHWNKTFIPRI